VYKYINLSATITIFKHLPFPSNSIIRVCIHILRHIRSTPPRPRNQIYELRVREAHYSQHLLPFLKLDSTTLELCDSCNLNVVYLFWSINDNNKPQCGLHCRMKIKRSKRQTNSFRQLTIDITIPLVVESSHAVN